MKVLDLQGSGFPITTLFMLSSVDGKISTGMGDSFDFDKDIPTLLGSDGIQQYYDLEKETDLWTMSTGKTFEKLYQSGVRYKGPKLPVTCVVVDTRHLSYIAFSELMLKFERVVIATTNYERYSRWPRTQGIVYYEPDDMRDLFRQLYAMGCKRLTLQGGGTLNTAVARAGLLNFVEIVIAPILVGGNDTPGLLGGQSISQLSEVCKLDKAAVTLLRDNYVRLTYSVSNHV